MDKDEEEEEKERQNNLNLKQIRSSSHDALETSPKFQTAQFLGDNMTQRKSEVDIKNRNAMAQSADITNSLAKRPR